MVQYLYWMAVFIAFFAAFSTWWLKICAIIMAGVFLFLANRRWEKWKTAMYQICELLELQAGTNKRNDDRYDELKHMVETLDAKKVGEEE